MVFITFATWKCHSGNRYGNYNKHLDVSGMSCFVCSQVYCCFSRQCFLQSRLSVRTLLYLHNSYICGTFISSHVDTIYGVSFINIELQSRRVVTEGFIFHKSKRTYINPELNNVRVAVRPIAGVCAAWLRLLSILTCWLSSVSCSSSSSSSEGGGICFNGRQAAHDAAGECLLADNQTAAGSV